MALRGFALGVTRVCFRTGWGNRITDAGLSLLGALTSLHRLDLSYTQVTDAGIARLSSLKQLRQLDVRETRVTWSGLLRLRALRGLEVTWGPIDDFGEAQVDKVGDL